MRSRLLAIAAALLAGPALAQVPAAPSAPAPARLDAFAQAMAARQVADHARRQKDGWAMLTAARLLQELPYEGDAAADTGFTAAGLFAEARALGAGDAALQARIAFAERSGASRGVLASAFGKGLVRSVQTVDPRAAYRFSVTAAGGAPLRIGAIGDPGATLAMRVQDAGGRTLCLDDNADYAPVCQLTPTRSGQFRIDIVNKGNARSRTVILSN